MSSSNDTPSSTTDFLRWLVEENGYALPFPLPGGRYACLEGRPYNTRIIVGRIGDKYGFTTAW
jgi:hypothetical protein